MVSKRLKLYYISENYIKYLQQFDYRVPANKNTKRPYIGIVYQYNGFNYFAPLSSPKEKHLKMDKKAIDIWKIDNGNLGIVNFNNMVPCSLNVLSEVLPTISDKKYRKLLENQIECINRDRDNMLNKIIRFHNKYNTNTLKENVKNRCCDFRLLESKCKDYLVSSKKSKTT